MRNVPVVLGNERSHEIDMRACPQEKTTERTCGNIFNLEFKSPPVPWWV